MKSNICIRANTVGFSHRELDTVLALAGGSVGMAGVAGCDVWIGHSNCIEMVVECFGGLWIGSDAWGWEFRLVTIQEIAAIADGNEEGETVTASLFMSDCDMLEACS